MFGFVRQAIYEQLHQNFVRVSNDRDSLLRTVEGQDQTIREMADEVRSMDQLIYRMTQCTTWETMRPIFNQLQEKQTKRQIEESNRIGDIMRKELLSVYAPPQQRIAGR